MNCAAILAAIDDARLTHTERVIYGVIVKGYPTRAAIAKAAGCAESSVPRAVRKLEVMGYLKREFSKGKANRYSILTPARTDTGIAADTGIRTTRTATRRGITRDTGVHPPADTGQPVDNSAPHIRNAGARAEPLTNITTTLEIHPETLESSGEGVARANELPAGGGVLDMTWTLSDKARAFAAERGYLNGSCDELFGQFLDRCATHGPRMSTMWIAEWRKWVRNQVQFDSNRKPQNGSRHDQPSSTSDVRRERISPLTAARRERKRRRDAEREPIDYGRVDSHRVE